MQATKSRLDVAADSDEQGNFTVSDKNNRGALPRASRAAGHHGKKKWLPIDA